VSPGRLRALTIGLLVVSAVLVTVAEGGLMFAVGAGCFFAGVVVYFAWRRAERASVFDRQEKTSEEAPP
jgi:hypothetical protein